MLVAMLDSIHTARWLSQFLDEDIDFFLFPSSPMRRVHPQISNLVRANQEFKAEIRVFPLARFWALPLWVLDKVLDNALRGFLLARWCRDVSPNYIHGLELQNAGYLILKAVESSKRKGASKILVTNWGSDIYWFQRFPRHRALLAKLFQIVDAYACECNRDVELALAFGFRGKVMPVLPNAGGFDESMLSRAVPTAEQRDKIAVKGYQGWVGRANLVLQAMGEMGDQLSAYEIVVYSANFKTLQMVRQLRRNTGLTVKVHLKGALSHDDMLNLFGESLIYVGASLSDGISTSMLEAMAMGAIPVQTSTACIDEWYKDSGVSLKDLELNTIKAGIMAGLELAHETDAGELNREIIRMRASREGVAEQALSFYRE